MNQNKKNMFEIVKNSNAEQYARKFFKLSFAISFVGFLIVLIVPTSDIFWTLIGIGIVIGIGYINLILLFFYMSEMVNDGN